MSQFLDEIQDASHTITGVAAMLADLSMAHSILGNETLARRLDKGGRLLLVAEKQINDAVGRNINRQVADQQEANAALFTAILSGAISAPDQTGDQ